MEPSICWHIRTALSLQLREGRFGQFRKLVAKGTERVCQGCHGNVCSSRWQQRWAGRELQAPLLSSLVQLSDTLPRSAFSVGSGLEQTYKALFSCHRRGGRDKAPLILGQQSVTDTWLERPHTPKPKDSGPCSLCGSKASGSRGPRLCLCPSAFPFLLLGRGFLPVGVGSAGARPLVLRRSSIPL